MWKAIIDGAKESAGYFVGELKLIFTDSGTVLLFVISMVIYPLLYAIGYEKETIRDLPVAVVDLDHSSTSRLYSRMVDATEQVNVICKPGSLKEAEDLFYDGEVKGVILIPTNFEKDLLGAKQVNVTAYCDASFFLLYKQVFTGTSYANGTFGAGVEVKRMVAEGKSIAQAIDLQEPVKVSLYSLYNPIGGYGSFVMPGMILIIMQQTLLIGIGMLGGTIREKKIFLKMTGRAKHRLGSVRLVFGKASAYVFVYLFNAIFAMIVFHKWFRFPDNGNALAIITIFIPYILAVSFLGLSISMLFKERVHSLLFLVFLSPMVMFLSGISWPTSSIPPLLYWMAHVFPSTIMIPAYLKIRIYGGGLESVHAEWVSLLIQDVVYFIMACLSYRLAIKRFGKNLSVSALK
jgi:ABC-2 type transport system permease protein